MPLPRSTHFNDQPAGVPADTYDVKVDHENGRPVRIGKAAPGSSTSAAAWQIQTLAYEGGVFVGSSFVGDGGFSQVWEA